MKKYLFLIGISIIIISPIFFVHSQGPKIPDTSNINIWNILETALNWFFGIALLVAVIMLIYAGFTYITSSGNEEKIKIASKTIVFALIGVAIALLARGIPGFIQNFLQGKTTSTSSYNYDETIPNIEEMMIQEAQEEIPNLSAICDCSSGSPILDGWCESLSSTCKELCCGGGGGGGSKYFNLV